MAVVQNQLTIEFILPTIESILQLDEGAVTLVQFLAERLEIAMFAAYLIKQFLAERLEIAMFAAYFIK